MGLEPTRSVIVAAVALAFALLPQTSDAKGFAAKAAELARLRGAAEKLESEIRAARASGAAQSRSLIAQKGDLALMLQKQRFRLKVLRSQRARQLARIQASNTQSSQLRPALLASIGKVVALVNSGLPFKRAERLAALSRLHRRVLRGRVDPRRGAAQLWQLVEDEVKLCQSSGLYRQVVTIGSARVLADVVKLGMVALFFRTGDGRVGLASRGGDGGYRFVVARSPAVRRAIDKLFTSLRKQIRSGFFRVPLPRGAP